MNDERRRTEDLTPAEERLVTLLRLLRADAPRSDPALTEAVVRTARWQLVVKGVLSAVGGFAAAAGDVLAALTGTRGGTRRG